MTNPKASKPLPPSVHQGSVNIQAKANSQAKAITLKPEWTGAKRRTYFNTFDLDRTSEKGFVVCRFAFLRWGECVDCITVLIAEAVIQSVQQNFVNYVKEVGLSAVDYDFKTPEIPRFHQGALEIADIINVARSGDIAEITLHAFSLPYVLEATKTGVQPAAEFVAILRSSLSLQIKWVVSLYEKK